MTGTAPTSQNRRLSADGHKASCPGELMAQALALVAPCALETQWQQTLEKK